MKKETIIVYSDPGHAWGRVKRETLFTLGVAHKVSHYSYQKGKYVYLEEDCDLSMVCKALDNVGVSIVFVEKHTNNKSSIRRHESFAC
tara:strand:+ start:455 stop:718 length:264 start_codon:yes stop_codon:yes gene_type:complete